MPFQIVPHQNFSALAPPFRKPQNVLRPVMLEVLKPQLNQFEGQSLRQEAQEEPHNACPPPKMKRPCAVGHLPSVSTGIMLQWKFRLNWITRILRSGNSP